GSRQAPRRDPSPAMLSILQTLNLSPIENYATGEHFFLEKSSRGGDSAARKARVRMTERARSAGSLESR
ncbi:MAG: hypothetical protein ACLQU3_26490, partial [Limisphaerales bacterium]